MRKIYNLELKNFSLYTNSLIATYVFPLSHVGIKGVDNIGRSWLLSKVNLYIG